MSVPLPILGLTTICIWLQKIFRFRNTNSSNSTKKFGSSEWSS